jgi:hypothetical protein
VLIFLVPVYNIRSGKHVVLKYEGRYDFFITSGLVNNLGHILHIFKTARYGINRFEKKSCGFAALLLLSTGTESNKIRQHGFTEKSVFLGQSKTKNVFWQF